MAVEITYSDKVFGIENFLGSIAGKHFDANVSDEEKQKFVKTLVRNNPALQRTWAAIVAFVAFSLLTALIFTAAMLIVRSMQNRERAKLIDKWDGKTVPGDVANGSELGLMAGLVATVVAATTPANKPPAPALSSLQVDATNDDGTVFGIPGVGSTTLDEKVTFTYSSLANQLFGIIARKLRPAYDAMGIGNVELKSKETSVPHAALNDISFTLFRALAVGAVSLFQNGESPTKIWERLEWAGSASATLERLTAFCEKLELGPISSTIKFVGTEPNESGWNGGLANFIFAALWCARSVAPIIPASPSGGDENIPLAERTRIADVLNGMLQEGFDVCCGNGCGMVSSMLNSQIIVRNADSWRSLGIAKGAIGCGGIGARNPNFDHFINVIRGKIERDASYDAAADLVWNTSFEQTFGHLKTKLAVDDGSGSTPSWEADTEGDEPDEAAWNGGIRALVAAIIAFKECYSMINEAACGTDEGGRVRLLDRLCKLEEEISAKDFDSVLAHITSLDSVKAALGKLAISDGTITNSDGTTTSYHREFIRGIVGLSADGRKAALTWNGSADGTLAQLNGAIRFVHPFSFVKKGKLTQAAWDDGVRNLSLAFECKSMGEVFKLLEKFHQAWDMARPAEAEYGALWAALKKLT
ncbi:MAG: hypothetical protein LBF24_01930 [Puniceicoccales bacterium]|jgi:hypothetical protein|nr:hypothetical protein [Puniceicoccales bacterium]